VLAAIGRNLTLAAALGEQPRIIGRDEEIDRCLDILAKRSASCPVLIGPPGVGKSATLLGLAGAASTAEPGTADDRILVELPPAQLLSGAGIRGAVAERMAAVAREVKEAGGRIVLVLDDIHQLFAGEQADEAGGELRAAIGRGELPCVGATTLEDHRRTVEADPALARRFTPVLLEEPDREEAFLILRESSGALSAHHGVNFPEEALAAAVSWSVRYMPGRALPDKALAVLDMAGARARRRAVAEVSLPLVAAVISEMTDVPAERMLETDAERMLGLEALLAETVVGHRPQLARIARLLRRNAAGIRGRRPIGTFLLLGPTGVGKTETAKAIAAALFHSPDAMTRLDLSEYAEAHSIARLVGAPPGYVGHEAGGQLTEAVRRRPYQVVLLDEIEKAHRDVLEAFLGVFDEGRLTDGRGRTVDFTNTVLVLTSNLGASVAVAQPTRSIGFQQRIPPELRVDEDAVLAAAREALPPELYNRIDEVQVFSPLSRDDVREIARRLLGSLASSVAASRGIKLEVDASVHDALLAAGGFDPELGARPMRRAIGKHVEGPLAEIILRDHPPDGAVVEVWADEQGEIHVEAAGARERAREAHAAHAGRRSARGAP
jgi:ATP-dependent Clp protease ATP-binding subunit ClpC